MATAAGGVWNLLPCRRLVLKTAGIGKFTILKKRRDPHRGPCFAGMDVEKNRGDRVARRVLRSRFRRALPQTPLISAVVAPDPLNPAIAKALVRLHPDLLLNIYPNGDAK